MGCYTTIVIPAKDGTRIGISDLNDRLDGKLIEFDGFRRVEGSWVSRPRKLCREHHHYSDVDEGDTGREILKTVVRDLVSDASLAYRGEITMFLIHEGGEYGSKTITIGKEE